MIGVELEHWLWYRSMFVSLEPYNFVAWDLYCVDGCRLLWVWACVGADVMHVCGCCWLIACSASVCLRRCFRLRLSHAYANLDCWVALLLSYYYFFFLLSLSFDFFFFLFFCLRCACAKSVRVPKVWSYITKSSTWRSRCQVYDNTRSTQDSKRPPTMEVTSPFERFARLSFTCSPFCTVPALGTHCHPQKSTPVSIQVPKQVDCDMCRFSR